MQILFGLNLPFSFFAFYANFLFFNCVIHYFGLQVQAARLILSLVCVGSPVLICGDIIDFAWQPGRKTQLEARKTIPSDPNLPVRGKDPHASINSCITLFPRLTIVFGTYLSVGTGIEPQAFCFPATVSLRSESPSP